MEEKKQLIGNDRTEERKETPEQIQYMIAAYTRQLNCSMSDKARITELMGRKSANGWVSKSRHPRCKGKKRAGWDATKKAQMVRRLMKASQSVNECIDTIDKLKLRLVEISPKLDPNYNVAPFVPSPATSV